MNQTKLFKILTIVLLIANVTLTSFLLCGNCSKKGRSCKSGQVCQKDAACDKGKACHKDGKCEKSCNAKDKFCSKNKCKTTMFFKELDLDSTQWNSFKELGKKYRTEFNDVNNEIKSKMKIYFSDLKSTAESIDRLSLLSDIQDLQKKRIEMTYEHFNSLKGLLKDDQLEKFDNHIEKAMKYILAKSMDNHHSTSSHCKSGNVCQKSKETCNKG